jgi:hypothetical protein
MRCFVASVTAVGLLSPALSAAAAEDSMTPSQIEAVERLEAVTIPVPGEFFVAMARAGQRPWNQYLSQIPVPVTDDRSRIALLLGVLVADGYTAVEAQDGQSVKNIGKEITAQAKKLNVNQSVLGRSNSINDFAENNDWNALREELEATQNEVKLDMAEQSDDRLVTLVSLGAWIRGIDIASRMVHDDYSRETAALLRQPAIVEFLVAQIDGLPESVRGEPLVVDVRQCLESSLPLISAETPSAENVEALKNLVGALRDQIAGMGETP